MIAGVVKRSSPNRLRVEGEEAPGEVPVRERDYLTVAVGE
jgi:hypothetical protein